MAFWKVFYTSRLCFWVFKIRWCFFYDNQLIPQEIICHYSLCTCCVYVGCSYSNVRVDIMHLRKVEYNYCIGKEICLDNYHCGVVAIINYFLRTKIVENALLGFTFPDHTRGNISLPGSPFDLFFTSCALVYVFIYMVFFILNK